MDELIQDVIKRTGLNEDQARGATKAVTEYLKDHLPEPASKALAQFLGGTEDVRSSSATRSARSSWTGMRPA